MTKIKLCGLKRVADIHIANELNVDFVGFVFASKSKRYVDPKEALLLKQNLNSNIKSVGVFVNADVNHIIELLEQGIIDIAQLHGNEDEALIKHIQKQTHKEVIRAFIIKDHNDVIKATQSCADFILLDSGAGTGMVFDWDLIKQITRPYFLAGGLNSSNVALAVKTLNPFAVDVSSGIETDGFKDKAKMYEFVHNVRQED